MNRLFASTFLTLALTVGACASGFQASRHYAEVSEHLDVGGDVLLYSDVEGDLAAGADYLDKLLDRARRAYPHLELERLKAARILRQLGLDQIVALGLSSARSGKAFHNKAFLRYGKERRGLLLFTGAPPRALEVPRQAPADVDVVFESELKLTSLLRLVEAIATDVSGKDAKEIFSALDKKLPGVSLSGREVLERLDTRLVGAVRIDEQRAFSLPDKHKTTVPGVDVLLSADDLAILFDAYRSVLQALPNVTSSLEGDMHWLEMEVAVTGAAWLKPVLAKHRKTGRLFLATSKAFVQEFLAAKGGSKPALAQAADWKRATARFERKANGLSYMSSGFMSKLARFLRPLGKGDKDVQMGIDIALELLPEPGMPMAAQQVNLPQGLYYTSYAGSSHKSTLFPALMGGPVALAGAVAGVTTGLFRGASRARVRASEGAEPAGHGQDAEAAGDAYAIAEPDDASPKPAAEAQPEPSNELYAVPIGRAPGRGGSAPKVTIVEYSDFQCPFCARVQETLQALEKRYGDDVRIHFKHNPLPFHARAVGAAIAAEAAHLQGKFWPMHDKLFANWQHLDDAALEQYAKDIGLDMGMFRAALQRSEPLRNRIAADQAEAERFGVRGTPSFFVNGRPLRGALPLATFQALIDEEIKKADGLLRKGTRRKALYGELTKHGLQRKAKPKAAAGTLDPEKTYRAEIKGAPMRGAKDALVTVVVFSDYQCPFCQRVEATLARLLREYRSDLRVAWRDMPLSFHNRAKSAAIAARAAGEQGKYWEMHDKLFATGDGPMQLGDADIERYAAELGLDKQAFKAARERASLAQAVEEDVAMAAKLGVAGTPVFFINGKVLSGAQPYEKFKSLVDQELKAARKRVAKGTPRARVYTVIMGEAEAGVERPEP